MFHKIRNIPYSYYGLLIGLAHIPGQAYAMESNSLDNIYENAILCSPLVKKIHEAGLARRQEEERQLTKILDSISDNDTKDDEKLRQSVVQSLEADRVAFEALNKQLKEKSYKPGEKGATYQLLNNRMPFITGEAIKLAQAITFFDILDGNLPQGYSIKAPVFNYHPNEEHIYSNGKRGNALKSLLLKIWLLQNDKSSLSEMSQLFGLSWLDNCPFVHITPLPDEYDVSSFQSSPHFFRDTQTPKALLTIHNGYAFGGHRLETRYPKGKPWGPHDCSSFTAHYTGCKTAFSTMHQAHYFQEINSFQFKDVVTEEIVNKWNAGKADREKDSAIKMMRKVLSPLKPNPDPQSLTPGLVHAERNYTGLAKNEGVALTGTGGHTGIFLGTIGSGSETQALTLSANRDLEGSGKEFAYGVEQRTFLTTPERMIMFFEVKK